ncbi:MAG: hypothetical protein Edafosvirus3_35 [Edafosvirus sp.]|uniref:Uncharacterized protein n=1 Tax=Edafosvirus sp. TaxID=2487765 RepID=A0A3G4ZSU6_9VIRU|nr:MAG: hypothetical protein Edafosvirus3_35 [Edafosvirus sp.]
MDNEEKAFENLELGYHPVNENNKCISLKRSKWYCMVTYLVVLACMIMSVILSAPNYNYKFDDHCGYGRMTNDSICICYSGYIQLIDKWQPCNYQLKSHMTSFLSQLWFGYLGVGYFYIGYTLVGLAEILWTFIFIIMCYKKTINNACTQHILFLLMFFWLFSAYLFLCNVFHDSNDRGLI